MPSRFASPLVVGVAAAVLLPAMPAAQKAPALPDLLTTGANYVASYAEHLGATAADEEYLQVDIGSGRMGTPRRVNCSTVWVGLASGTIDSFRDVVALDRAPIRPKDDRLMALFQTPTAASRSSAHEMTENAVTQYLDPNLHALDQPLLALDFLRAANQERSTFKIEGLKNLKGAQVAVLKFTEKKGQQPLIATPEKTPASGRFWIDPADGGVRQTELMLSGDNYTQKVTVTYANNAAVSMWLPVEMYQQSEVSGPGATDSSGRASAGYGGRQAFEGRATYTNFRHITVDTSRLR
jgi:hypothetical protein